MDRLKTLQFQLRLLGIVHAADPEEVAENLKLEIESLIGGDMEWSVSSKNDVNNPNYNPYYDDDLPDLATLNKLKQTIKGE